MKFNTALWLSLVLFTIHNLEEYFTMASFFKTHLHQIPPLAARFAKPIPNDLFIMMLVLISILAIGLIYAGVKGGPNSPGMFGAMMLVTGGLFVNGLHHLAITLYFGDYSPGVITSIGLFIPYSIYLCRQAVIEHYIKPRQLGWSLITGTALIMPLILLTRSLASFLLTL
ncbi:MAG: HXXEE domain-containing protein [Methylocystaceae bacterium]